MTHAYASMLTVLALAAASAAQAQTSAATYALGTYQRPYAARSPWNSRPVSPSFGTFVIPPSLYYPAVAEGAYSTGVFKAASTDLPVTIVGTLGTAGVWDADSEAFKASITLPRWPATVIPATGSDGHADVIDTITGVAPGAPPNTHGRRWLVPVGVTRPTTFKARARPQCRPVRGSSANTKSTMATPCTATPWRFH